jgi:hypothetical protein
MMPTTEQAQLTIQPTRRIEKNCSWWELSFVESDDYSDCSSSFAEHSIISSAPCHEDDKSISNISDDSISSVEGRSRLSYFQSGNASKDVTAPTVICKDEKPSRRGAMARNKQRSWRTGRYIGFKEQANRTENSDARRGLIRSALYSCIDEEEEDFLAATTKLLRPNQ